MIPVKEPAGELSLTVKTDRVGKLFLVLRAGMRRCLICDEVFTHLEAAKHSRVLCGPADPYTTADAVAPAELSD